MRPKLALPIVAITLAACQTQPATQTADTTESQTAAAAAVDAKALVARAYEAFNNRDFDAYAELFTADADTWSTDGSMVRGVQNIAAWDMAWVDAFPDARITSSQMVAEGSFVVSQNRFTGTHEGTIVTADGNEIPATGNQVDVPYVAVFEIEDGKVKHQRIYYNVMDMMEQLGQMP
jgi:steroid delta-isomerase-like uncharacterized protein